MCGIVGYIGHNQALPFLMSGLKRLEYRGYDSAGIAIFDGHEIRRVRSVGKLSNLSGKLQSESLPGHIGIGHTRWATHGKPNEENAHPHLVDGVVVVHNGIIENYQVLKQALIARGRTFYSQTDTEVLGHLVADHMAQGFDFEEAARLALQKIHGAFAVMLMSQKEPDKLIAARNAASPLIVGLGEGETFVASDIPALLGHTKQMLTLQENEYAIIRAAGAQLYQMDKTPITRAPRVVDWSPAVAERGGYKHFMLKEIDEQPQAFADTLRGRIQLENGAIDLQLEVLTNGPIDRVLILAMGTSFHAGLILKQYIESFAKIAAVTEIASEFRYRDPVVEPNTLCIAISQSGETADTLAGVKEAKRRGAKILTITNVMDSSLARLADASLYTRAGVEIGVASTKAYTAQIAAAYLLALQLGVQRGVMSADALNDHLNALVHMPSVLTEALQCAPHALAMAKLLHHAPSALFLGRGLDVATACEGALKLKELSYIHAEGYAAGEMKHGPIALIDEDFFVVMVSAYDPLYDKLISNAEEVRARGGRLLSIVRSDDTQLSALSEMSIRVPTAPNQWLQPVINAIPLQLLAYHAACLRGHDVDQPRNLAKSVTVE